MTTQAISKGTGAILLLNLFSGVSIRKIWKAMNLLQFTIYVSDWKLAPPSNIHFVIKQVKYFCRGDWLPKERIMAMVHLGKEDMQAQHTRLLLIVAVFVLLLGLCLAGLAFLIKKRLNQSSWIARQIEDFRKYLFWNCFIRTLLQSYLDYCVSVALIYMVTESAGWNRDRIILAGFLTLLIVIVPLFFFRFLQKLH